MLEKEKLKQKYSDKIAVEKERNTFETHKRLKEQEIEFKVRLRSVFNPSTWDLDVQYCNIVAFCCTSFSITIVLHRFNPLASFDDLWSSCDFLAYKSYDDHRSQCYSALNKCM
jgi:hypothetical protein